MARMTILNRLEDLYSCGHKYASDPIHLSSRDSPESCAEAPSADSLRAEAHSLGALMHQNSIAVYENAKSERAFWNRPSGRSPVASEKHRIPEPSIQPTILPLCEPTVVHLDYRLSHEDTLDLMESRDDVNTVPSLLEDDLIVARPFGRSGSFQESIEIINVSSFRE